MTRATRILMWLGTLVAAGAPLWMAHEQRWQGAEYGFAASYAALLVAAGVLACLRSTGAQLLARSVWWSMFGGGVLIALFAPDVREMSELMLAMVRGPATALLAVGRSGLDGGAGGFAPAAYRAPIMMSMVMAMADAQALGWLGAARLYTAVRYHYEPHELEIQRALAALACCAVALIALYGLYRLRLWGLVLSAMTTLAIGALVFTPVLDLADGGPIPYALVLSAAVQLALLAPLFAAIVRRRAPAPPSPRRARLAAIVPVVVIVALTALSVITVATGNPLARF
jgi:hypothetical protein